MKKISIIPALSVLIVPAFAETNVQYLYGDPANIGLIAAQNADVQQLKKVQTLSDAEQIKDQPVVAKDVQEQKITEQKIEKAEEPKTEEKKVEKKKEKNTEKQTKLTEEKLDVEKTEEPKIEQESVSNPNAKFPNGLQFGIGVSPTSGLNAFVGYNNKKFDSFWWKRFGVRLDFATYSPIKNIMNKSINGIIDNKGIRIDDGLKIDNVNINAKHIGALVDFYPFGDTWFLGGLRISGGYMTGNMDVNANIRGTQEVGRIEFELGDRKYAYDGTQMRGTANVNWKYSGPYAGTGFDLGIFGGFKLYLDAGVVFTNNNAKIDLNVPIDDLKDITDGAPQEITGAFETKFNEAKDKALSNAQKELDKIGYFPIVKLGFMYRF